MGQQRFSIRARLKSFKYAFSGLMVLFIEEHNARIHLLATIVVVGAGFYYGISSFEWIAVLLCIALVLAMELLNSAIEALANFTTTELQPLIKKAKDLAAGAVLISSIIALIVGVIVFVPKLFDI